MWFFFRDPLFTGYSQPEQTNDKHKIGCKSFVVRSRTMCWLIFGSELSRLLVAAYYRQQKAIDKIKTAAHVILYGEAVIATFR